MLILPFLVTRSCLYHMCYLTSPDSPYSLNSFLMFLPVNSRSIFQKGLPAVWCRMDKRPLCDMPKVISFMF